MDLYHFISFIRDIWRFARSAKEHTQEDEVLLGDLPEEYRPLVRQEGKQIVKFACLGAFVSLVVVPVAGPLLAMHLDNITLKDAAFRGLMLLLIAVISLPFGILWGASIGILAAPRWYLDTELGRRWRQLCGVKSIPACRTVALVVVLTGATIYTAFIFLTRTIAPFN
jgi:hypothetical protein